MTSPSLQEGRLQHLVNLHKPKVLFCFLESGFLCVIALADLELAFADKVLFILSFSHHIDLGSGPAQDCSHPFPFLMCTYWCV